MIDSSPLSRTDLHARPRKAISCSVVSHLVGFLRLPLWQLLDEGKPDKNTVEYVAWFHGFVNGIPEAPVDLMCIPFFCLMCLAHIVALPSFVLFVLAVQYFSCPNGFR